MIVFPNCKINLGLNIVLKRNDGFHNLETVFFPIQIKDILEILPSKNSESTFTQSGLSIAGTTNNNICIKAYHLLKSDFPSLPAIQMHLHKIIPMGAGLGGGSSDAAAVLMALDRLLATKMPTEELERVAAAMGSDIPFFIRSQPAICRGRGEIIEPFEGLPPADILLVKPPFPIPTPWAYQAWANSEKPSATFQQFHGSISLVNDLENPVFSKYLLLPVLKSALRTHPAVSAAMMSGSGSTIFAILRDSAQGIEEWIRSEFGESFQTFRARLLNEQGHLV